MGKKQLNNISEEIKQLEDWGQGGWESWAKSW